MIKHIFGVLKKHFKVLLLAQEYSFATQAQIVSALAALHNFIITHDPKEISTISPDEVETDSDADNAWSIHQASIPREERIRAAVHRDQIALMMWEDYNTRLPHRHI